MESAKAEPPPNALLQTKKLTKSKSVLASLQERAEEAEKVSQQVPDDASLSLKQGIKVPIYGQVLWVDLWRDTKLWLRSPLNIALLIWIILVTISGAILFLVMTGMLNAQLKKKSQRNTWFEVCSQILSALFTFMCLVLHPGRIRASIYLARWQPADVLRMRKLYSKDGLRKPNEWKHMLVVNVCLHLNCIFQYGMAAVNWAFTRHDRPAILVGVFVTGAIGFPAVAGLYNSLSPLGRDYSEVDLGEEEVPGMKDAELTRRKSMLERSRSFYHSHREIADPEWQGGLVLGCCDNVRVCYLSALCCFCIHGCNQERLGFGNKFVHMVTFALFVFAPFLIFDLSAINLNDTKTRTILGGVGIVASVLGLLYGGYWRIQMRQVYRLPPSRLCCGHANASDCATWLFCSLCALCQEVRTAEHYEIAESRFFVRSEGGAPGATGGVKGLAHPDTIVEVPEDDAAGGGQVASKEELELADRRASSPLPAGVPQDPLAAPLPAAAPSRVS
eukprot:jgi/Mesen1/7448/ME000389S06788